jgi:peptidoglycan/LPS O-acetylase OafA/YrhL
VADKQFTAEGQVGQRPAWLRSHVPELDGLRGIAILAVVFYHCEGKFTGTELHKIVEWGWAGVNLFFVLSGFLITGIILDSRDDPHFFRNFYARRSLRIWPVYVLLLLLVFVLVPLVFDGFWTAAYLTRHAPWPYLVLFVQNLFVLSLPGTIGPTWSLAIEEQFYVVWAPVARFIRNRNLMIALLMVIVASPFMRAANHGSLTPTHTLIHLDGLAFGSLIAVALRTLNWSAARFRNVAIAAIATAIPILAYLLYVGSAFSDSFLALLFAGMLLLALTTSGSRGLYNRALNVAPLRFYGRISYGLYMIHILAFTLIGAFDEKMSPYGVGGSMTVVAVRIALATLVATAMWYCFEQPILKLKRYFHAHGKSEPEVQSPLVVATAD